LRRSPANVARTGDGSNLALRMTGREQPVALDGVPHFPEIIKQMPEFQLRRCVHGLFNDGSDYFNK
jgi:hypothetical protein